MSYVHCHLCQRAFDVAKHNGCPICVSARSAATSAFVGISQNSRLPNHPAEPFDAVPRSLAAIASEFSIALAAATTDELADLQANMRDHHAVAEALAVARRRTEHENKANELRCNPFVDFARSVIVATLEAATLRLVHQVEQARGNLETHRGANTSNVVDLYPTAARLDAAKRWVTALAA
jgi:hypothetical protein